MNCSVREATLAEKVGRDRLTSEAWGGGLTQDLFLEREKLLRAHPWCLDAMKTWLCLDGARSVMSSCETFKMQSSVLLPGHPRQRGTTYGIASVYTDHAFRKRGFAQELLTQVIQKISLQDPHAMALILYSEVGKKIYEKVGFVERPTDEWVFSLEGFDEIGSTPDRATLTDKGELLKLVSALPLPSDPFCIEVTPLQFDWHYYREEVYCTLLGRPVPTTRGAVYGDGLILWSQNFKSPHLQILSLSAPKLEVAEQLIGAALREAWRRGLLEVKVWGSERFSQLGELSGSPIRVPLSDCIAMISPLKNALRADDWKMISRGSWI